VCPGLCMQKIGFSIWPCSADDDLLRAGWAVLLLGAVLRPDGRAAGLYARPLRS
jgi:hypothetical protein